MIEKYYKKESLFKDVEMKDIFIIISICAILQYIL